MEKPKCCPAEIPCPKDFVCLDKMHWLSSGELVLQGCTNTQNVLFKRSEERGSRTVWLHYEHCEEKRFIIEVWYEDGIANSLTKTPETYDKQEFNKFITEYDTNKPQSWLDWNIIKWMQLSGDEQYRICLQLNRLLAKNQILNDYYDL